MDLVSNVVISSSQIINIFQQRHAISTWIRNMVKTSGTVLTHPDVWKVLEGFGNAFRTDLGIVEWIWISQMSPGTSVFREMNTDVTLTH